MADVMMYIAGNSPPDGRASELPVPSILPLARSNDELTVAEEARALSGAPLPSQSRLHVFVYQFLLVQLAGDPLR